MLTVLSATLATSSGQLHVTIELGGGRRFEVVCDVAFMLRNTVCAAEPHFRPGRPAFKANGPGRAGPGFRPDTFWHHRRTRRVRVRVAVAG